LNESLTLADLRRWEDHGATWRALEVDDEFVVLQLCTCFGEPVELRRSDEHQVIEYVREHRSQK